MSTISVVTIARTSGMSRKTVRRPHPNTSRHFSTNTDATDSHALVTPFRTVGPLHLAGTPMSYNFPVAAIVSVLLAVAAMVQGVSGQWLFVGVAVVTVALEILNSPGRRPSVLFPGKFTTRRRPGRTVFTATSRDIRRATDREVVTWTSSVPLSRAWGWITALVSTARRAGAFYAA